MNCPYCNKPAIWVENKEVYGRNYGKSYMIWLCKPCDAFVGCHNNTKNPLGIMANKELRGWKMKAHRLFDPLWKGGSMTRKEAYVHLRNIMGMGADEAHIGMFDVDKCKKLVELLSYDTIEMPLRW